MPRASPESASPIAANMGGRKAPNQVFAFQIANKKRSHAALHSSQLPAKSTQSVWELVLVASAILVESAESHLGILA